MYSWILLCSALSLVVEVDDEGMPYLGRGVEGLLFHCNKLA